MKFELHLEENEANEDINALSLTMALEKFVREQNNFNCTSRYVKPLLLEDIGNIIKIICESDKKWFERIKEQQNER